MTDKNVTIAGTDIDQVKNSNEQSGMSYNEAKAFIARTSGGHATNKYSNTNIEKVRQGLQVRKK